jgi:hypothetical protein
LPLPNAALPVGAIFAFAALVIVLLIAVFIVRRRREAAAAAPTSDGVAEVW